MILSHRLNHFAYFHGHCPAPAVPCEVSHAYWMLGDARKPTLCPIHVSLLGLGSRLRDAFTWGVQRRFVPKRIVVRRSLTISQSHYLLVALLLDHRYPRDEAWTETNLARLQRKWGGKQAFENQKRSVLHC